MQNYCEKISKTFDSYRHFEIVFSSENHRECAIWKISIKISVKIPKLYLLLNFESTVFSHCQQDRMMMRSNGSFCLGPELLDEIKQLKKKREERLATQKLIISNSVCWHVTISIISFPGIVFHDIFLGYTEHLCIIVIKSIDFELSSDWYKGWAILSTA